MSDPPVATSDPGLPQDFLAFYDDAVPRVYGYICARCRQRSLAEDLTAETFLAAVDAVRRDNPPAVSVPWIMGVARHKLVDHWRRQAREESGLRALSNQTDDQRTDDFSDVHLDAVIAHQTLGELGPHHQAVLTLRYLDDLPVPEVATLLGRSVQATEALLVRAKRAFRLAYDEQGEETSDV